jgi:hypothetical protein
MCGEGGCNLSDEQRGNNGECTLTEPIRNGTIARAWRSTTSGEYKHCWDALSNAISQCFRDTSVGYTGAEGKMQGNWAYEGESYWIQIISGNEFLTPQTVGNDFQGMDGVDNDDETPGRE